jgi:hypothetical protein
VNSHSAFVTVLVQKEKKKELSLTLYPPSSASVFAGSFLTNLVVITYSLPPTINYQVYCKDLPPCFLVSPLASQWSIVYKSTKYPFTPKPKQVTACF